MRHPDLHPNPETIDMPTTRQASARIELAQHTDGRWMWAVSWRDGFSGHGYACGAKWNRFAQSRQAALDAAIAEGLAQTENANTNCPNVRAWLTTLNPVQGDLFLACI